MSKILLLLALTIALCNSHPLLSQSDEAEDYEVMVVPFSRMKRDFKYDISKGPGGTRVTLNPQGTIFDNGNNKLLGGGIVTKNFDPTGPTSYGGNLEYLHRSGSGLSVGAVKTPGFGTDLGVQGKYNIWNQGGATLDAVGQYNRHYGGPYGTGKPDYYGGLQLNVPFGH